MKTFKEFFQLGVTKPSKSDVQNYLNGLGTRLMQLSDIKKKIINHFKNIKNLKLDSFGRKVLSFEEFIPETRDYKAEYKKHQSSPERIKYRAELVKYNRDKGTYGNGDGKDASHKDGKIVGFEGQSKNRGRAEASRLKGSKRKVEEVKQGHALVVGGKIVARGSKSVLLKKVKKDKIKLDPKGNQNFLTYTGKEVGDNW